MGMRKKDWFWGAMHVVLGITVGVALGDHLSTNLLKEGPIVLGLCALGLFQSFVVGLTFSSVVSK